MASVGAQGAFWRWQDCKIYGQVCCGLRSFWRWWDCMIDGRLCCGLKLWVTTRLYFFEISYYVFFSIKSFLCNFYFKNHMITSFVCFNFKTYGYKNYCVFTFANLKFQEIRQCYLEFFFTFSTFYYPWNFWKISTFQIVKTLRWIQL
jgi:hypothetical protein